MASRISRARPSAFAIFLNYALSIVFIVGMIGVIWLIAPVLIARQFGGVAPAGAPALPTAHVAPPISDPAPPVTAPISGIAQNEATSQAMYQATAQAAEPVPNTNVTGDSAPLVVESKPVERQPAGVNVPTAEPLPANNDQFGSKAAPINPQETHQCLNGQVWVEDKGCKNP